MSSQIQNPWDAYSQMQALDYLGKSRGIQRTRELAMKHANLAAEAIDSLPESGDEDVLRSRRALIDLTHRVITRTKWRTRRVKYQFLS